MSDTTADAPAHPVRARREQVRPLLDRTDQVLALCDYVLDAKPLPDPNTHTTTD